MSDLPILTLDDFAGSVGQALTVETDDGDVSLVLTVAEALSDSAREGGAFRLEFEGPLQHELAQGIYGFQLAQAPTDIFIVPIARTATAMRYEAVFF
jgi:hypothetical protein